MCCATIQNCTSCYFELLSRHALVLVCPLPEAEPVAGRETKLSATMSCPLPRIGDSRTVRQVADAHAAHGTRYGPLELGASWNTLGKLVRQQSEKHVLRGAPAMLQPLAEHTERALPKFGGGRVACGGLVGQE